MAHIAHLKTNINFEEYWNSLQETVKNILTLGNISRDTWYKCFNNIFILCVAYPDSHSQRLYDSTKFLLEERVLQLLCVVQTETSENLIENYYSNWQKYWECIQKLDVLYHNYNTANSRERKMQSKMHKIIEPTQMGIRDLGLYVWKSNMILQLKDSLPKLIFDDIDKLRRGISITTSLDTIFAVINTFIEVQESNDLLFEEPFLNISREYIKCEILRLTKEFNMSEYLVRVVSFYEEEIIRSKKLLPEITQTKVYLICRQQLVIDKFNSIHREFETILKEERIKDMRHTYLLLFNANHGLDLLAKMFREYIEKLGKKNIESLKPKQIHNHFIEEILNLHENYKSIVEVVFDNHFDFNEAFNKAFRVIMNNKLEENQSLKLPEYVLKYCDMLLKKSFKGICDAELHHKLLQTITLFKYMDDKNVFQSIYQKQLAQRLLLQLSHSLDIEEKMINKLKKAWGYELTIDLHQMLLDIRMSDKLNAQFISELNTVNGDLNISFSTHLLQKNAWPLGLTATSSFVLPSQLKLCEYNFETFYKKNFKGRKLTWFHHQSQGELKLNYLQNLYIVTMHTIQMSILLLFEDCDSWKYSEISNALQLTNEQFKKHINSLLECKLLLLDGGNVNLNMEFKNKHSAFHIRSVVKKKMNNQTD